MKEKEDIFSHLQKRQIDTPSKEYFADLADGIIEGKSKPKVIPIQRRLLIWTSSAAAVLMVALFLTNTSTESDVFAELNDIPTDELLAYLEEHIDEFETELFAESLTEEELKYLDEEISFDLKEITYIETKKEIQFENVSPSEINEYLELEDLDVEDLENDFI